MKIYELALIGDFSAIKMIRGMSKEATHEIEVCPKHIIAVLNKYLANEISDECLVRWADLLISNENYICPNWQDDTLVDMHEPMWYVLQRIASPSVDGNLSPGKVSEYLKEVENVEKNLHQYKSSKTP